MIIARPTPTMGDFWDTLEDVGHGIAVGVAGAAGTVVGGPAGGAAAAAAAEGIWQLSDEAISTEKKYSRDVQTRAKQMVAEFGPVNREFNAWHAAEGRSLAIQRNLRSQGDDGDQLAGYFGKAWFDLWGPRPIDGSEYLAWIAQIQAEVDAQRAEEAKIQISKGDGNRTGAFGKAVMMDPGLRGRINMVKSASALKFHGATNDQFIKTKSGNPDGGGSTPPLYIVGALALLGVGAFVAHRKGMF